MTSARELLEQADALMRRRRTDDEDLPVLDDIVSAAFPEAATPTTSADTPTAQPVTPSAAPPAGAGGPPPTPAGVCAADGPGAVGGATAPPDEPAGAGSGEASLFAPVALPPRSLDELIPGLSEPAASVGAPEPSISTRSAESAAWRQPFAAAFAAATERPAADARALAERSDELYMSVVQRLDLLIERRLAQHLATGIRPIVERAGEAMVERLGSDLRETLRGWVAEAIEQELRATPADSSQPASSKPR